MKIIEALKELKLITKKISDNNIRISQYAAVISNERPPLGDEETQKKAVAQLLQSNLDLWDYYMKLKRDIEYTNIMTQIDVGGYKIPISTAIQLVRKSGGREIHMGDLKRSIWLSLSTNEADARLRRMPPLAAATELPKIIPLFDEKKRNEDLQKWMEITSRISATLEVVNATADLIEAPEF